MKEKDCFQQHSNGVSWKPVYLKENTLKVRPVPVGGMRAVKPESVLKWR